MVDKNYIILAHSKPKQLLRLIHRLDDGCSRFYVHISKDVDEDSYSSLQHITSVSLVKERVTVSWGDFSIVQATLNCINTILKESRNAYTILLSGQCYPITCCDGINTYLKNALDYDHITLDIVANNWENAAKRIFNYKINLSNAKEDFILFPSIIESDFLTNLKNFKRVIKFVFQRKKISILFQYFKTLSKKKFLVDQQYGGSQWFAFSFKTLLKVEEYLVKNPSFCNDYKYTLIPDELFFHTIIGNLAAVDPSIRIRKSLTYVNWELHQGKFPVVFSVSDFSDLQQRSHENYLFARKFDADFDVSVLDMLDKL